MEFKIKYFVFAFTVTLLATAQAQTIGIIKGKIIDRQTKQTIIGANVLIKDLRTGAPTDTSGNFVLKDIPEGVHAITVSYIGYQDQTVNDIQVTRNKTTYLEIEITESVIQMEDVTVTSYRYENSPLTPVSMYSFSREEISRNPGAQGDIFRAIGMLPGVSSSGGQFSAIAVRGQGTRDNVYMVDDIPVFSLAHLDGSPTGFDDPNGGRFSIFAPRVVDNAQFQGGGFAAQYGRRSSSYLGLGLKEGSKEGSTFDGQLDLLGATINYDGPSYFSPSTSLFISARFQDFSNLVKLVGLENIGVAKYQDLIFKSTTELNSKTKLSIIANYSPETYTRDTANVRADKKLNELFIVDRKVNQGIFGINARTITGKKSYWRNVLYYNFSDSKIYNGKAFPQTNSQGELIHNSTIGFEEGIRKVKYSESRLGFRSIFNINFDNYSKLTTGLELDRSDLTNNRTLSRTDTLFTYKQNDFRPTATTYYSLINPQYFNADYSGSRYNMAAFTDYSFTIFKKLTLNTGLRYDYTGFTEQHTLSPRMSGSWQLNEMASINFSTGIFYQDPSYSTIADQPENKKLANQKVTQAILGYKIYFTPDLKLTIEGWYKALDKLLVRAASGSSEQNTTGTGWAEGVDVNLTKRLSTNIHGQIGYSYMRSKRNDNDGTGEYDFTFSQPHAINLLASYKHGQHWIFSGKFRYSTGKPTYNYVIHDNVLNDSDKIRYSQEITSGQHRMPDFISLDLRVDYKFQINKLGLTAFIDIQDVLNRTNPYQELFNPLTGKTLYDGGAIFPTFGLKFQY